MNRDSFIKFLLMLFLVLTVTQVSYLYIGTQHIEYKILTAGNAVYNAEVSIGICVDKVPTIINTTCPTNISGGQNITCNFTANIDWNVTFFNSDTGVPFHMINDSTGEFRITTFEGEADNHCHLLGNYEFFLWADTDNTCGEDVNFYIYPLEIYEENDAPIFNKTIPSMTISAGTDVGLFDLNNYFYERDCGQELTYSASAGSQIFIVIVGTGTFLAHSDVCGISEQFTFTAIDPYNLTTTSNIVTIDTTCEDGPEAAAADSGGSGGSGAGSFLPTILCTSLWECTDWNECSKKGVQIKNCYDAGGCSDKIYTYYQNCTYHDPNDCIEEWECTAWDECRYDNTQTRTCTELSACNTENNQPAIIQDCTYIPTCNDGIQNQGEIGIDCGGPCLPCDTIYSPTPIEKKIILSTAMLLAAFLILSLLLVYKYFHKSVNIFILRMILGFIEKKKKKILLTKDKAKKILDELTKIQRTIKNDNLKKKAAELGIVGRKFIVAITGMDLTFTKETLILKLEKKNKIKDVMSKVVLSLFYRFRFLETTKGKVFKSDLLITIEEIRELIRMVSNVEIINKGVEVKELAIKNKDSASVVIKKQIYNTYISMHFDKLEVSKLKYTELMKEYEDLEDREKDYFYDDLVRMFNEIKYLVSISK